MAEIEVTDQRHFEAIPWCLELLQDPDFVITPTPSRHYKDSTEDALFAETLKTRTTVRACLSLYRKPSSESLAISELCMLVSLGYGVNGYPNICHGGIIGTVIDEAMGTLISLNKRVKTPSVKLMTVTAYLNVTFLQPVATPQTVLVTARLQEVKDRKVYLHASITDSRKIPLAKAKAMFIEVKETREKL